METYRKEDIRRGDIYYADLSPVVGSEQGGIRPVVILQNNVGNRHSPTVIAAAITSRKGKHKLPTTARPSSATAGVRTDSRRSTRSRQPLSGASSPGSCWDTASGRSPPT